jgi:glycosyltransferase involved in cell wall biosynthesis
VRRQTIVTLDFPPLQDGGIARWMDELARGFVEVGAPTTVLTRGRKPPAFAHDATYPAPVTRLPGHGWVRRAPLYLRLYAPFLGALRGAVVHAATWATAAPLAPTVRRRGGHLVVYVHGLELVEGPDAPRRATLQAADRVVANSRHVAALAIEAGAAADRVHVVAPAIDPARVTPDGPDLRARWGVGARPLVLTLGRLVER